MSTIFVTVFIHKMTNDNYSEEKCDITPEECKDIIPYTTLPNRLFGLNTEAEYLNFTHDVQMALQNCTMDEASAKWAVCNMMFPRCLLGWELQVCKKTCLGTNLKCLLTIGIGQELDKF